MKDWAKLIAEGVEALALAIIFSLLALYLAQYFS